MPNFNQSTRNMLTSIALGMRVDRATDNITTGEDLFNIEGGNVLVTLILGEVTTAIENKTVTFKLQVDPDTGTTTDLCANLDLDDDEIATLYTISGTPGDAMQEGQSGNVIGQAASVVCAPGVIQAVVGDTHTGSIKWSVWYLPLEEGAYVTAA